MCLILLSGCFMQDNTEKDFEYVSVLLERLKLGSSIDETRRFFQEDGHILKIFNNCKRVYMPEITPCEKGYSATGHIKLPSNDPELGNGRAHIYLKFNGEGVLNDHFHDLFYENQDAGNM